MAKLAPGSKRKSNPPRAVNGYKTLGGHDPAAGALRNVLAQAGAVAPHSGKPWSEAMLLGLGGGLGFEAKVIDSKNGPFVSIDFSNHDSRNFVANAVRRIGGTLQVHDTDNATGASRFLTGAIKEGHPALTWVDLASLPWHHLPADLKGKIVHLLVVYGLDDDASVALVDDRCTAPLIWPEASLAGARAAIPALSNRIAVVAPPTEKADLGAAISEAVKSTVAAMTEGSTSGLKALAAFAETVGTEWATIAPPGPQLVSALISTYRSVEQLSGAGALRGLYGQFLAEAAEASKKPKLATAAGAYAKLAADWTAFARSLLPDDVNQTKYVREALDRMFKAVQEKGAAGTSEADKAASELASTTKAAADKLSTANAKDFYAGLQSKLKALHKAESAAAEALASAI